MKKSNHEILISESWDRLQLVITRAETAYNDTVTVLQELGKSGVKKTWIGQAPELGHEITPNSLYTHEDTGSGSKVQHDILSRIGVGSGCSNGSGKQYQTQINPNSLVYGTYELNKDGWVRID